MTRTVTSSESRLSPLPVRTAVRACSARELDQVNAIQRKRHRGRFQHAEWTILGMRSHLGTPGALVPPTTLRSWVDHPDERVPIFAGRHQLLCGGALRRLARRALADAQAERLLWTPLLDVVDWHDVDVPAVLHTRAFVRLSELEPWLRGPSAARPDVVARLLQFANLLVSEGVAFGSIALEAAAIRQLASRGILVPFVSSPNRTDEDRRTVAEWAVGELERLSTPGVVAYGLGKPTTALCLLDGHDGFALPIGLAARLALALRDCYSNTSGRPASLGRLHGMILRSVEQASPRSLGELDTQARAALLRADCPEVRLATMRAINRAKSRHRCSD